MNIRFHPEEGEEAFGEFSIHDGIIDVYLGGHRTIWGLYDTLIHEQLHEAIDWATGDDETTEKQDHWIMQRLCF